MNQDDEISAKELKTMLEKKYPSAHFFTYRKPFKDKLPEFHIEHPEFLAA
jgi:hypothetical protein